MANLINQMLMLRPAARYPSVAQMVADNPVVPSASYHYVMLADCGRIPAITHGMVDGTVVAPAGCQPAIDIILHQRERVHFSGLKRWASLGLFLPHPSGMPGDAAAVYLAGASSEIDLGALIGATKIVAGHGVTRWKVRVDVELDFTSENDNDQNEYVWWAPGQVDIHVPFIYTEPGDPAIVSDALSVAHYVRRYMSNLRDFIDDKLAGDGSARVFHKLVGTTVWATPCCVVYGAGQRDVRRGEFALCPNVYDKRCIARAIMTALDPLVYARLSCTLASLRKDANVGALMDVMNAEKRMSSAVPGSIAALKRAQELDAARHRLASSTLLLNEAIRLAAEHGYPVIDPKSCQQVEGARVKRRYVSIEATLRDALAGRGAVDLRHPFFQTEQVIDADAAAFVSSCLPPGIKVQFWTRNACDSIALSFKSEGATLSFLQSGGRILNLFCDEGHVTVVSSVDTMCASLSQKHQRVYCELCGISVSHTGGTSLYHSKTALNVHQEAGCPRRSAAVMCKPLSQDNIRQLAAYDFPARWPLSLHMTLCVDTQETAAAVLRVSTPGGSLVVDTSTFSLWSLFLPRFSESSNSSRSGDMDAVVSKLPVSGTAAFMGSLTEVFTSLFVDHCRTVWSMLSVQYFRNASDSPVCESNSRCYYCDCLLSGPSRSRIQADLAGAYIVRETIEYDGCDNVDEEHDDAIGFDDSPAAVDAVVLTACPSTGATVLAHSSCVELAARASRRLVLNVDVVNSDALSVLASHVMHPEFVEGVCGGVIPTLRRNGNIIRCIQFRVGVSSGDKKRRLDGAVAATGFLVRIRAPGVAGVLLQSDSMEIDAASQALALSLACSEASIRSLALTRMNVLYFETEITYARTALYASIQNPRRPVTSLVSASALASYALLAKGGRILTGCSVLRPPLIDPLDRSTAILSLDFTAAYPSVAMNWPLPHEGHLDTIVADFTADLAGGLLFIGDSNPSDPERLICRAVVSGHFPDSTHARLSQFPPLFSRLVVPVEQYSDFQRRRMGRLLQPEKPRTVSHLMPVVMQTMFVREARILKLLGFEFTHIGEVRGCPASFWARDFMLRGEAARREAATPEAVADVKRIYNSVVGATNVNMGRHPVLKSVWSDDVVPEDGFRTGAAGIPAGDSRANRRTTRLADDPRFTGRVFATDHVTMIERFPEHWKHKMQPEWALAVQAYARCDQLELWYGCDRHVGIVQAFPHAKLLYGNTDSLVVELSLDSTPSGRYTDVRAALYHALRDRMDLSNVPSTSTFWSAVPDEVRSTVSVSGGRWGWIKEETGMAGYEAFVVNGPNRWGARVVQSPTDTLPKHRVRRDILKMLPKAWTDTSLEQYAASWSGGHTPEEVSALSNLAPAGVAVPVEGTCVWGNTACRVNADGTHSPFGMQQVIIPVV